MMQTIMKCGLIGGFILFIWSVVAWTVLPWQKHQMMSFSNEREVKSAIVDNAPQSGLYVLPNLQKYANNPEDMADAKARMSKGPFVVAAVALEGRNGNMVGAAVQNLILKIVAACLVTWLLFLTNTFDHTKVVKFVVVAGIVIALSATVPMAIWFAFPISFVIGSLIEIVLGWLFAGLAIARMIKK